jgi:hypothetical protein
MTISSPGTEVADKSRWSRELTSKLRDAHSATELIHDGEFVFVNGAASFPCDFVDALSDAAGRF